MSVDIEELRRRFFPPEGRGVNLVFQGVVTEIDENNFTCTVRKDDSINYYDVRLRALIDDKLTGLACIPKLKSIVLVCRIGGSNEVFVCQFSEIDKIVYTAGEGKKISFLTDLDKMELKWGEKVSAKIDDQTIKLTNDATTFEMLKDQIKLTNDGSSIDMQKDKIKLNEGEDGLVMIKELTAKLNDLVSAFNGHTHLIAKDTIVTPGGKNAVDVPVLPITSPIPDFTRDAYENTKILQ